jgi:uncharacterized protein YdcH (DUF465 family)
VNLPLLTHVNEPIAWQCKNSRSRRSKPSSPHKERHMFPEYRDLISRLKTEDAHFSRLFQRHNELDHQIHNMETGVTPADSVTIDTLKREKLLLKDRLYAVLKKADAEV